MFYAVRQIIKYLLACIALLFIIVWIITSPSNNRNWSEDQAILPSASVEGNQVFIKNIRNFRYKTEQDYTPGYYSDTFDVSKLLGVYYIVEPFSGFKGSAHTFLSFEFEGNKFVAISAEIRKEKGETFSALKGLFNQYELMYVVADEQDVIALRTNIRKDKVYVYPVQASDEAAQRLFLDMIARVNKLKEKPEFYNTIFNTCTTNIVRHVNSISPRLIPLSYKILLPEYSDQLAYDLKIIDTSLPLEQLRQKYLVNEKALLYANDPRFSVKIRQW